MYVQYIRELNSQLEQSPSPPLLLEIRAGYWRQGKPSTGTESSMHQNLVKIYCMYCTQECVARSQKVHLLSAQNGVSRLKHAAANFLLQRYRSVCQSSYSWKKSQFPFELFQNDRSVKDIFQLVKIQLSPLPPLESWSVEMCQSVTDRSKCFCGQRSKMAFQG